MYKPRLKSISLRFLELNSFSAEYKSSKVFRMSLYGEVL